MRRADPPLSSSSTSKKKALLGVGLDKDQGEPQTRLTRGKNFTLLGGSEETHAVMKETAVKVNERLDRKGMSLEEVSSAELRDMILDINDRIGRKPDESPDKGPN